MKTSVKSEVMGVNLDDVVWIFIMCHIFIMCTSRNQNSCGYPIMHDLYTYSLDYSLENYSCMTQKLSFKTIETSLF